MGVLIFAPFPSPQSLKLWRTPLHLSISNFIHKCTSISIFLLLGIGVIRTSCTLIRPKNEDLRPKTPWTKTKTLGLKRRPSGLKRKPSGQKRRPLKLKRRPSGLKRRPLSNKLLRRFRSVVEFPLGYLIVIIKSITHLFFDRPRALAF